MCIVVYQGSGGKLTYPGSGGDGCLQGYAVVDVDHAVIYSGSDNSAVMRSAGDRSPADTIRDVGRAAGNRPYNPSAV